MLISGLWSSLVLVVASFSVSLTLSVMFSSVSQGSARGLQHHQHPVFVFQLRLKQAQSLSQLRVQWRV